MVPGGGMDTEFSLALISATSNLRNLSASSVSQNSLSHLESRSSRKSSPPSTKYANEERSSINRRAQGPIGPMILTGRACVLKWGVPKEGGEDLAVHLWPLREFLQPFESSCAGFGAGLVKSPVSPDLLVSPCPVDRRAIGLEGFLCRSSVQRSSSILGDQFVELPPVRGGVEDGLGCGHGGTDHMG